MKSKAKTGKTVRRATGKADKRPGAGAKKATKKATGRAIDRVPKANSAVKKVAKQMAPRLGVSPAAMAGLERGVKKMTSDMLGRKSSLSKAVREEGLGAGLALAVARVLEEELRGKMPKATGTLADLIHAARDGRVLSEDCFHLANRIRHVRNHVAHDAIDKETLLARNLMVVGAAVLVWVEAF